MNLAKMRTIVTGCMPYDTGFMFTFGAKFSETAEELHAKYDTVTVPYIIYQEEGTRFSTKNQFFIRDKTIGALLMDEAGAGMGNMEDKVARRAKNLLLTQGMIEKYKAV